MRGRGGSTPLRSGYLPGLDGLRALSVVAVLLFHAEMPWLPGGFLGVEVFFVISGYLITLLLTDEQLRTSRVSLRSFWTRRARRLLPALYAVLTAGVLVVLVGYREEAAGLAGQVWSALTYVTNWYFIGSDQAYFAVTERPPVFQHLWSLAIEEQFYLLWPPAIVALGRRFGTSQEPKAAIALAAGVASVVWMAVLHHPGLDPSRAYYGTDTRASGLLFGAALAFVWRPTPAWRGDDRRSVRTLDAVGVAALAVLALCFLLLHDYHRFLYRGGFAVVSIASLAAILAAVHPATVLNRVVLGQPALRWIGVRSYSLYLWHWPIFVFTRPQIDQPLGLYPTLVARLALTVAAAEVSYRCVETPIRNGALARWRRRLAARQGAARYLPPALLGGAAATLLAVVSVVHGGPSRSEELLTADVRAAATAQPLGLAAPAVETPGVTVLGDSVLLGAQSELTAAFRASGLEVDYRAQPAWQVDDAARQIAAEGRAVAPLVVIGLGHNSIWERDRRGYEAWAGEFDGDIDALLSTLRSLGAQRFVWVTLREPDASIIPPMGRRQYQRYVWYFPYVNERLRLLVQRDASVRLADWAAVSNRAGLTYDAMHLTDEGIALMRDTILQAAEVAPPPSAAAAAPSP